MRRLYLRFYLALLGSLVLFAISATAFWHRAGGPVDQAYESLSRVIQNMLPPADAPAAVQQAALARMVGGLHADAMLLAADRHPLAQVGQDLSLAQRDMPAAWRVRHPGGRPVWAIRLPDQRWLLASVPIGVSKPAHLLLFSLLALALAVAVMAFPIVRQIARRLERLQYGVEQLGTGDLRTRVAVEGRDEVAQLAASFNQAAERIEALVLAHKSLLANASHELRTPLTRIRLAIELMKSTAEPKRQAGLERDIAELDQLIDEILLASRLDAVAPEQAGESIDLLALAAEEGARYDAVQIDGGPLAVTGDARLLRRLLRNLLENAHRHGAPPVHLHLAQAAGVARVTVMDAGPGVPADEYERIFAPFYRRRGSVESTGAGLGLALVRQIARRHGGDAVCQADADGKTAFVITLRVGDPSSLG